MKGLEGPWTFQITELQPIYAFSGGSSEILKGNLGGPGIYLLCGSELRVLFECWYCVCLHGLCFSFKRAGMQLGYILTSCDATDYDAAMLPRVSGSIIVFSLTIYCANPSRLLMADYLTADGEVASPYVSSTRLYPKHDDVSSFARFPVSIQ